MEYAITIMVTVLVYRVLLARTRGAAPGTAAARLNAIMGGGGPGPTDESAPQ